MGRSSILVRWRTQKWNRWKGLPTVLRTSWVHTWGSMVRSRCQAFWCWSFLTNQTFSVFLCDQVNFDMLRSAVLRLKQLIMCFCLQYRLPQLSGISSCHLLIMTCFMSWSTWLQVTITASIHLLTGRWSFDVTSQVCVFTESLVSILPCDDVPNVCLMFLFRFIDVCEPRRGSTHQRALLP